MSFIWPWVLVSLAVLPVCVVMYLRLQRRRSRDAARLGTLGVVGEEETARLLRRRHIPPVVFLAGLLLLALASARPEVTLPTPRMEGTVVLAFDVSASMAADDVEPTRMEVAKETAQAIVDRRPNTVKIGVVAFGEGGLVVQPPTDDHQAISATIDRLVPQSGTSLGRGILTALNVVSSELEQEPDASSESALPSSEPAPGGAFAPAIIVLLTDGENTDPPDPLEVAQVVIESGVRVYTVGVGTAEGATLEIDGFNVSTRLNEGALQEIALLTEGAYFKVDGAEDIPPIYEDLDTEFVIEPRETEVTSFLGGVSALVLLAGSALSLLWFGRIP